MLKNIKIGDYVLATKYNDGDPHDHFVIGYYNGITASHYDPPRYDVIDNNGQNFRGNGFRRIKKISKRRGDWMIERFPIIENSGRSVWWWARQKMGDSNE